MLNYKRQGAGTLWVWSRNSAPQNKQNAMDKHEYYYDYTDYVRKHPGTQWIAENNGSSDPCPLVLVDPKLLPEYLKKVEIFPKAPTMFKYGVLGELTNGSIFFAEGEDWAWKRKILSPSFSFEALQYQVPIVIETTQQRFGDWIKSGNLTNMNFVNALANITGEIAGKFVFGKRFGNQQFKNLPITMGIRTLVGQLIMETFTPLYVYLGPKFSNLTENHKKLEQDAANLRQICYQLIREGEKDNTDRNNVLGLYLKLREKEPKDARLNDDRIVGEFVGLFQAGTDTVSHLVNSAVYFLWKHPEMLAKVKAEYARECPDLNKVTLEDLNRMDYTTAFFKETLRLGGPNGCLFARVATHDTVVGGFKIKAGTTVKVFNAMWYPFEKEFSSPEVFDPERFMNNSKYTMNDAAFVPFSTGPRTCLGKDFAVYQAKLMLAVFLKTFEFEFSKTSEMVLTQGFTYEPISPLMITLKTK